MGNNVRWTVCKKYTNEKELVFAPLPKHIIAVLPIFFITFFCFVSSHNYVSYMTYMIT